ncbi:MAG: hypothetical protein NTY38_09620 [Acidobacteria bacterium]|nr:hypothetical protein [Acidobacteriota bacterium]
MAGRKIVQLTIEVPDDVVVVPVIVRKPGGILSNQASPGMNMLKVDLTTQKAAAWLNGPGGLRADNCCCVRGFIG